MNILIGQWVLSDTQGDSGNESWNILLSKHGYLHQTNRHVVQSDSTNRTMTYLMESVNCIFVDIYEYDEYRNNGYNDGNESENDTSGNYSNIFKSIRIR